MTHTDIKSDGWISRFLPAFLQPYAYLARLDRPVGIWLLLLPCLISITLASGGLLKMNGHDYYLAFLFTAGAVIMRAAGCTINDLWDRELDKKVERTQGRPLAAGTITVPQAFAFLGILLVLGLMILLQLSFVTILLGLMAIPLVVLYPLMKRITWWPQAFLGITFNFGALMGWAAVTGVVGLPALLLYLAGFFWTLAYDTIYAHQDKDDDIKAGIKSSALRMDEKSKKGVVFFYITALILAILSFATAGAGLVSLLLLPAAALYLAPKLKNWDPDNHALSLALFRNNRNAGLLVLLAAFI